MCNGKLLKIAYQYLFICKSCFGTEKFSVMGMAILWVSPGSFLHVLFTLLICGQCAVAFSGAGQQETTCEANGSVYYVGEWYFLDSDHCTQCECTTDGSACARTECASLPVACIHVSHYPKDCCPICEKIGCEYGGEVYELGQHFQVNFNVSVRLCIQGSHIERKKIIV